MLNPNDKFIQDNLGEYQKYSPEIQHEIIKIVMKMISFSFVAKFIKAEEGPVVRVYYFEPSPSSSISSIISRDEDIALMLAVDSVMISRELGAITIAVPRKDREIIKFDSCLYNLFQSSITQEMELPILMGKDMKGNDIFIDLYNQPHLLIGGATGSGKSVFTSQLIASLALRKDPKELEFILVDTKQLDLVLFSKLSHSKQIITDIHALRSALENLIAEVRTRTAIMSGAARNIKEWNANQENWNKSVYLYAHGNIFNYKILIIDEFADVVGSDREWLNTLPKKERPETIETLIQRLAQISRAAGIHIILATQRPSARVISGDVKTNFSARIAFKLPTMQDSRVVLDENGAEKLLGKGDYLYKVNGSDSLQRGHSAFVEMKDIQLIIEQHEMLRRQFLFQS